MPGSIRILLFASAREATGASHLERPVDSTGVELSEVVESLAREFPRLARVLRVSRVAVNGEYARSNSRRLRAGDEIAIHPPYSGG